MKNRENVAQIFEYKFSWSERFQFKSLLLGEEVPGTTYCQMWVGGQIHVILWVVVVVVDLQFLKKREDVPEVFFLRKMSEFRRETFLKFRCQGQNGLSHSRRERVSVVFSSVTLCF